jgi:hypothetical protein
MATGKPRKQPQKRPDTRQISPDELVQEAAALQRRLTRSLNDWDSGDADAIRDVAGYTRTLIGFGKGDGLLRRLQSMFAIDLPDVRLYSRPDVKGDPQLAIGGLPVDEDAKAEGADLVSFSQWLTTTVVVMRGANRRDTDWAQFVTDYGNTYGAHVSGTVPRVLEDVRVFHGPNGHMGGYLLRSAAIVAERALVAALVARDLAASAPARKYHPKGLTVTGFAIGQGANPWHAFGMSAAVSGTHLLLGMPLLEKYMTVTWSWDGVTPAGGSLEFKFDADRPS